MPLARRIEAWLLPIGPVHARRALWFGALALALACTSQGETPANNGDLPNAGSGGRASASAGSASAGLSGSASEQAGAGGGGTGSDTNAGGAGTSAGGATAGTSAGGAAAGTSAGGAAGGASAGGATAGGCNGPVGSISGALATGVAFMDTEGQRVNAHGGGIIQEGDTFYLHGEYFLSTTTDNNFHGFAMYSSKDLATWKNEGLVLPEQASGELGPDRKGERPHIVKCPATGEFMLYAHAASLDYQTDKEVVYATSSTVNGKYGYQGPLKNGAGELIVRSDMSAYADETGAYVLTESGRLYALAADCHSWVSQKSFAAVNGDSTGAESPTVFKANGTYYWIGSNKTGWRANNNFYSTAPAIGGPWTYQGYLAPVKDPNDILSDERTWLSQSTWVQPITGCKGTLYLYFGDHWDGTQDTTAPGKHNYLATYVFQPLVFTGAKIGLPAYHAAWKLDVGAGTWSE